MKFQKRTYYSHFLNQEVPFNVYGHAGKPVIVFPSSGGSCDEFADYGMIEACQDFIDSGRLQFFTVESYDHKSWLDSGLLPEEKSHQHNRYDAYIVHELAPMIRCEAQWDFPMMAMGCSMGAFHAINFSLKHPDLFDVTVALSGVYDARFFTGEYQDNLAIYFNSPVDYLANQSDPWFLDHYRRNRFIVAVGQGAWEGPHIHETKRLEQLFQAKGISGWFDYWGEDVAHDWYWWREQIVYFLNRL